MIERKAVLLVLGAMLAAGPAIGQTDCAYKGSTYSHGAAVCQSGSQYRCNNGQWSGLGVACTENAPPADAKGCTFDGAKYSSGSTSCQSGTQQRCDDGGWVSLAVACSANGQAPARAPAGRRTCMYNEATVATASTICKAGITFRCDDGEWTNLGTACR